MKLSELIDLKVGEKFSEKLPSGVTEVCEVLATENIVQFNGTWKNKKGEEFDCFIHSFNMFYRRYRSTVTLYSSHPKPEILTLPEFEPFSSK
jgi:hypothetical protein